jgi:hypothetical protein
MRAMPASEADLRRALGQWTPDQIGDALAGLEAAGRAQIVERDGTRFWSAAASHYPDEFHRARLTPAEQHQSTTEA